MKVDQRVMRAAFAVGSGIDPRLGRFAFWCRSAPVATVASAYPSLEVARGRNGWTEWAFDHHELDAISGLHVLAGLHVGRTRFRPGGTIEVPLDRPLSAPRRRTLLRNAGTCRYLADPLVQASSSRADVTRVLFRVASRGAVTRSTLRAVHRAALAGAQRPTDYSAVLVPVSLAGQVRSDRLGNYSSGYLSVVRRGEDIDARVTRFVDQMSCSRAYALWRLQMFGRAETTFPGLLARIPAASAWQIAESAVVSSVDVRRFVGQVPLEDFFLEVPARDPRGVAVGVLRFDDVVNYCIAGRYPVSTLRSIGEGIVAGGSSVEFFGEP